MTSVRWLVIAIACAGCPADEPPPRLPVLPEPPSGDEPLPASNCARGIAPPITFCRERREGLFVSSMSQSSEGALYVQDWTNVTSSGQGHVEWIYGDGFPIERHETGTFAGQMTTVCNDTGRVQIEHNSYAAIRTYFDTANRMRSFEWDSDKNGVFETRDFYTYDDAGRLIRDDHDAGPGTPIDRIYTYDYDERGRMVAASADRDADGDIDATWIHEWDELDREIVQTSYEHGEPIERWTWTYEGERLVVTEIEGDYRWTNSYDARGRLAGVEFHDLVADHIDAITMRRYDELDRPIEDLEDDGVDGTIDERITWEYCR